MQVITEIGHLVVHAGGEDYIFIPSFLNMTKLGNPTQIVDIFTTVYGGKYKEEEHNKSLQDIFDNACFVMDSCCVRDCSVITGYIDESGSFINGLIPPDDIITLARHLLKNGLIGNSKGESSENKEYSNEFNAKAFVYMAVAHLGLSEIDAWNMTMTSLSEALKAKFPEQKKVSQEEYDEVMNWADKAVGLA